MKYEKGEEKNEFFNSFINRVILYDDKVIMAAGAFTQGSSIELSADGPMREPYIAFMQGGLTYESGRYAVRMAAEEFIRSEKNEG